jgi:hypothetical protein
VCARARAAGQGVRAMKRIGRRRIYEEGERRRI